MLIELLMPASRYPAAMPREPEYPIGHLSDQIGRHWIWLHCSNTRCRHSEKFDPLDLIEACGNLTLRSLVMRAKCVRCGTRGSKLTLQPPNLPDRSDAPRSR